MASKVLDATSFYAGIPFSSQEIGYTTPLVLDEVMHIKRSQGAIDMLVESGRLKVIEPEQSFTDSVLKMAGKTGDLQQLSREDVSIIALCLQLGGELVTDDFAISNVAKHLHLKVLPVMTGGAARVRWVHFCPGCGKRFSKISLCPICGSKLFRKRLRA